MSAPAFFFLPLRDKKKLKIKTISNQLPLPGKHAATLWRITPYSPFPLFDDIVKIFESSPGARCYSAFRFRGAEDKWFIHSSISREKFPDHLYLFPLLTFGSREAMCFSQRSCISSIPSSCWAAQDSKTFFLGLAWAESSSAWCSAWQEGRWLLCCHTMQSAVVDHLEAETGGAVEHRGSSFYFESVAWRSKSRQGKLRPALLPQISQPAVHQPKILLIRFSMGDSKALRSLPWAGEFPWVQDHQGSHLASRLWKQ